MSIEKLKNDRPYLKQNAWICFIKKGKHYSIFMQILWNRFIMIRGAGFARAASTSYAQRRQPRSSKICSTLTISRTMFQRVSIIVMLLRTSRESSKAKDLENRLSGSNIQIPESYLLQRSNKAIRILLPSWNMYA